MARTNATGLHVRRQGARPDDRSTFGGPQTAQGPARGAAARAARQETGVRPGPPTGDEDEIWARFLDGIEPLRSSGKLGAVLPQYPRWFFPTSESRDEILRARERLRDAPFAVELRHASWFNERNSVRTIDFFQQNEIPFVMVDAPPGTKSSLPPMALVTSPKLAVVRFHGRRTETWEQRGIPVVERFRCLYDEAELGEWVPRIRAAAEQAPEIHVLMNNCYANYGTTNARENADLLAADMPRLGT
ncbi:MAG: DUF72 domain-containing protein [Candidatus Limnocylindria bacterium]